MTRGVEVLKRQRVAFNVLTTVHCANQDQPLGDLEEVTGVDVPRLRRPLAVPGGCPKDRTRHILEAMRYMADELRQQRPPAGLMPVLRDADAAPSASRPCPCGSGRQDKHGCVRG